MQATAQASGGTMFESGIVGACIAGDAMPKQQRLHAEVGSNPLRCFATLEYRCYDEVRAAHHIAAGKDFRIRCLKRMPCTTDLHTAARQGANTEIFEPRRRTRTETESNDHGIGRDDLLGARDRLGTAPVTVPRRAEPGPDQLHAFDPISTCDFQRLAVEQELNALFATVCNLASRARHVRFVTAVGAGDIRRALADRGAIAVHAGVAATEHDHALAGEIDRRGRFGIADRCPSSQ